MFCITTPGCFVSKKLIFNSVHYSMMCRCIMIAECKLTDITFYLLLISYCIRSLYSFMINLPIGWGYWRQSHFVKRQRMVITKNDNVVIWLWLWCLIKRRIQMLFQYGKIPEYFQNRVYVTSDFEKVGLFWTDVFLLMSLNWLICICIISFADYFQKVIHLI